MKKELCGGCSRDNLPRWLQLSPAGSSRANKAGILAIRTTGAACQD